MRRLVGMLARRGYGQSMAVAVVSEGLAAERERRRV
jgi:regulatory protein